MVSGKSELILLVMNHILGLVNTNYLTGAEGRLQQQLVLNIPELNGEPFYPTLTDNSK